MKIKDVNGILFVLCVICATVAVVCAGYYMWHQMNWSDETVEVRAHLEEEQALIDTLVAQIDDKKEAALANQRVISASEEELTQEMMTNSALVDSDIDYIARFIEGLFQQGSSAGGSEAIIASLNSTFGLGEESSFVKNLCPRSIIADHMAWGIGLYAPVAYSYTDFNAASIGGNSQTRNYFGVLSYRLCGENTDWVTRRVGFFFTVEGDTAINPTLSIGDGYIAGVIE